MAEIAGLVLGALPLLISALEHYEDFVEPAVAFIRWKGQLSKVTRCLLMEHTAYEQSVRLLLKEAVSNEDLVDMVDDPQSDLWRAGRLVSDLQSRLGHAYTSSMSTIREIAEIMVCIAASLNIEGSDKVTQQGLEAIVFANPPVLKTPIFRQRFHFKKRVAFTMKRRATFAKLEQLRKCNTRLYEFLEKAGKIQNDALSDASGPRVRIRFVAPLQSIQGNASRVHRVLHQSWCTTHGAHRAGLLLEQRLLRRRRVISRGLPQAIGRANCFGVSLWRVSASTWLDAEFSVDEDSDATSSAPGVPTVTFSLTDPLAGASPAPLSAREVTNICSTIQAAAHPLVGFCLDSSNILRGLYEVNSQPCRLVANSITLDEFLPDLKRSDFPLPDFYSLALTLVSAVLQLGETPWLCRPWSKQDILFLRLRGNGEDSVDIKHPYLTSRHDAAILATNAFTQPQPTDQLNMLALAIMLLEINFGRRIESLRRPEDLGPDGNPNVGTDLSTAKRWLETQMRLGNLTSAFTSAITYCLQCYLDPTASFANSEFSKTVEERVLEPLEREMQLLLYGS